MLDVLAMVAVTVDVGRPVLQAPVLGAEQIFTIEHDAGSADCAAILDAYLPRIIQLLDL